ncbi:hypothetical protein [Microcystis phage Mae-JY04]|uniref:hypothetical protein n=1 Tax=Blastomonas sp. TaxID=1909299 RepID=UPI00258D4904|nr:hypothetical protein [Blastomonas sp.]
MTSIAQMKAAVLAAGVLPDGTTSTLLGQEVTIRAITVSEEAAYLQDGVAKGMVPICAACIVDGLGVPVFTREELGGLKAGALKGVYADILGLSYPKSEDVGNGSPKTRGSRSASS